MKESILMTFILLSFPSFGQESEFVELSKVDTVMRSYTIRAESYPTKKDKQSLLRSLRIACRGTLLEHTFKTTSKEKEMTSWCSSECHNWILSGSAVCIKD